MPETPETPTPDEVARLLQMGLEPDATMWVSPPKPRSGSESEGADRRWEPPTLEALQQMLPQYEISAFIARGGMGAVYKGTQKTLKRPVAIKVLPPEIEDGDLQFAARFKHEAQAMAKLSHPNIVAVFDAGETPDGLLYFVMEFIEGTDVAQLIASEGQLDPLRAIQITTSVCEALAFAHEEGIIHRDIKPSNIMLDKRGRVKVADFGLAKTVNVETALLTGTNMAMGTPDFIAPEALISGVKVDQRADIYAVGVMLYQMLTGHIPRGRFELPSGVVPQVDKGFDPIVDKAMQTDREKRYSTALEMKQDVERVATAKDGGGGKPARSAPDGGEAATRNAGRSGRGPLLIAAAVVVLGGAAWFVLPDSSRQEQAVQVTLPAEAKKTNLPPSILARALPLWNGPEKLPAGKGIRWENNALCLQEASPMMGMESRDAILRTTILARPGSHPFIALRARPGTTDRCQLSMDFEQRKMALRVTRDAPAIQEWDLPPAMKPNEWMPVELRAIGDTFSVWVGGQNLGAVQSSAVNLKGQAMIYGAGNGDYFRDIEYIPLDGLNEAEALKSVGVGPVSYSPNLPVSKSSVFPAGQWVPLIRSLDDVPEYARSMFALSADGQWIIPQAPQDFRMREFHGRNWGLKAVFRREGLRRSHLLLRVQGPQDTREEYRLGLVNPQGVSQVAHFRNQGFADSKTSRSLSSKNAPAPMAEGDEYTLEFYTIGSKLIGRLNGKLLHQLEDSGLQEGTIGLNAGEAFRNVEVINLDGLSEAEALKVAGIEAVTTAPKPTSASPSSQAEAALWVNATEEVKRNGLERNLLSVEGDWLIAKRGINYFPVSGTLELADAAVRVVFRGRVQVKLRQQPLTEKLAGYIASIGSGKGVGIGFTSPTAEKEWLRPDIDLGQSYRPEEEHELVFAVHSNQLIFVMDGNLVARVQDARFQKGKIELATLMDQANDPNPTRLKKVEYLSLEGLNEEEALKAAGLGAPEAAKH